MSLGVYMAGMGGAGGGGGGAIAWPLLAPFNGTAAAPVYSWASDPDTGMYRIGANQIGWSVAGGLVLELNGAYLSYSGTNGFAAPDGAAATPAYTFFGDLDCGMWRAGANDLRLQGSNGGANVQLGSTGAGADAYLVSAGTASYFLAAGAGTLTLNGSQAFFNAGSAANPVVTFAGDPNTGLYNAAADSLGITCGGLIKALFNGGNIQLSVPILHGAGGGAGAPDYSFDADANTGFYRVGADEPGVSSNGALRMSWPTTGAFKNNVAAAETGAANAGAAALPANPRGFLTFVDSGGTSRKIPYYDV